MSTILTTAATQAGSNVTSSIGGGTYTIGHASGYTYPTTMNTGGAWASAGNITTASPNINGQSLEVKGDANITGELTIKGKKLSELLENIEKRLAILHPNLELEEKWEHLRGLREAYVELEREIIEKEAMWAILKK